MSSMMVSWVQNIFSRLRRPEKQVFTKIKRFFWKFFNFLRKSALFKKLTETATVGVL